MIAIQPLSPANLASAVEVLVESFFEDPLFAYIVPNEEQRRRWLPIAMEANLRLTWPEERTYIAMGTDGKVIGVIGASPPGAYPYPNLRNLLFVAKYALLPNPFVPSLQPLMKVLRYVAQWEKMHYASPHWYVFILGVRPEEQGKGLGKRLLAEVYRRAETDRLPVYLETHSASNASYYQSMGFEITVNARPQPDGPQTWGLLRAAAK